MGKDEYYARVQELTDEAMERLSLLVPSLTDLLLHYWQQIQAAADRELSNHERTSLMNLSFFYFLGTCMDFLFFLHLRHRQVTLYQHELEHILSVMMTHARTQQEALTHEHTHGEPARLPPTEPGGSFNLVDFAEAVRRLKNKTVDGDPS